MTPAWAKELQDALGIPVETDADVVASMSRDQAPLAPGGTALALVRARSTEHVVATLRFANERGLPVVTRGGGSGLAGGANAVDGCILLSVAAMDRVLRVDASARVAVVEPGVLNATLASEVAKVGLFYAPDPSSREISTIGGNIATNAGGACCLKYGVTGDHVAALSVVLPTGETVLTGALTAKNVAGLDLTSLLVGSEGTLGVIVEATVRLLRAPRPASTLLAFFETPHAAARAIVEMEARADLSLIELMDRTTVDAVERMTQMGLDTSAGALVLVQSDSATASQDLALCEQACSEHGSRDVARSDDPEEGRMLRAARRMALPALEKLGATLLDDVAVPKPALATMIERIEEIAKRRELVIGTFGHAGDGNLHPTIVFDGADDTSRARARLAFDDIVKAALELGGTLSGEHGIGSLKVEYMTRMLGEAERALMKRVKAAFDPRGILNPGKGI